jgi:hypothetical protein
MRKSFTLFVLGLIAASAGCHSPAYNARVFHPWGREDAADAKAHWDQYSNIFMVCIYADHWEDRGPHEYALHHEMGTIVRVYKGGWRLSEKISFVQGLDGRAPLETNKDVGTLGFVFTNEHTNTEIGLDVGDYARYGAVYEPALDDIYPPRSSR